MQIVKAEILWSRKCSLRCPYCSMANGRGNTLSVQQWCDGIDNLKALGCGFIAFYGAEPLLEFEKLPPVVQYAEENGIHTTVITSGNVPNFSEKLKVLYEYGSKSLSMSHDIRPLANSSKKKSDKALNYLSCWQTKPNIRDSAAIVTLTRKNYSYLIDFAKTLTQFDIWTFFDLIHWDRGQPGSKCRTYDGIEDLKFKKMDIRPLVRILEDIIYQKQNIKIHTSPHFCQLLIDNPTMLLDYNWNCANYDVFPSWVTVDCNGLVYPCDDFQPKPKNLHKLYIYELANEWDWFSDHWRKIVKEQCPGCLWNTHIDAHAIKSGDIPFSDYVHTST